MNKHFPTHNLLYMIGNIILMKFHVWAIVVVVFNDKTLSKKVNTSLYLGSRSVNFMCSK